MNKILGTLLAISMLGISSAHAVVAIGNGNYFIGFTDLEHPNAKNDLKLKIQRTYNSRSQYDGNFGYGWGSDNEGFLIPSADGSVIIQEKGGGDKTRFSPKDFTKASLDAYVTNLAAAYAKKKGVSAKSIQDKLLQDADFRDEQARDLGIMPNIPVGTKLYSTQRGDKQLLVVTKDGYVREYSDGNQELYDVKVDVVDQSGQQKKRLLKGVYKISKAVDTVRKTVLYYTYDKKGRLTELTDKKGQSLRYQYTETLDKVVMVTDASGAKASYRYCESSGYSSEKKCGPGDLISAKNTKNETYTYQYDELHNLIKVGYPGGGAEEISYWPLKTDAAGGVKSVKSPNGTLVEYKYIVDPANKDEHYKTELKTTYTDARVSTASYEYWEKRRADGARYRYKLLSVVDDEKTETIYNECCGQPLQITASNGVTKFEYYAGAGLVKEKNSPTEVVQWEYHSKFHGKITKVNLMDKTSKAAKSSIFTYDDKGLLVKAKTSDGKGIALLYDKFGRIETMVDQDKRKLSFKYNIESKPSEITQEGVGAIVINYDKTGNIKDVQPKGSGGRQIAVGIASAFQNLLEIIKPAGIQPI